MSDTTTLIERLATEADQCRNDGGPAYPCPEAGEQHFSDEAAYIGMTLRDYFAAHASDEDIECLRTKIENRKEITPDGLGGHYETFRLSSNWRQIARYMHADLMIKARKERS